MQSMHQPHPCYLLKQSFWNPIWGQCRLNKISFWYGLPLRMGPLCLSRQNQLARKVCPVLHGWWCVLRLTIPAVRLGLPSNCTLCFLFPLPFAFLFPLPSASELPAAYLQGSAGQARMVVYFGVCLIAYVAVCVGFTVFVVVRVFIFYFDFVVFCFPCPRLLPCFLRCWILKY